MSLFSSHSFLALASNILGTREPLKSIQCGKRFCIHSVVSVFFFVKRYDTYTHLCSRLYCICQDSIDERMWLQRRHIHRLWRRWRQLSFPVFGWLYKCHQHGRGMIISLHMAHKLRWLKSLCSIFPRGENVNFKCVSSPLCLILTLSLCAISTCKED